MGFYEAGREILPPSQMPLGGFKRKVLDGFSAKRLTLLMTKKKESGWHSAFYFKQLITHLHVIFTIFIFMEQKTGAQ